MTLIFKEGVEEVTTTVGTGSYLLGGAIAGGFLVSDNLADGDTGYFDIRMPGGPGREIILGTFSAPSTLARTSVISSSNSDLAVDWPDSGQRIIRLIRSPSSGEELSIVYVTPSSGDTLTAVTKQGGYEIVLAVLIATLDIVLPPGASDEDVFEISSTKEITALTVTAAAGDSVIGTSGGPLAVPENGGVSWRYRLSNNSWYPRSFDVEAVSGASLGAGVINGQGLYTLPNADDTIPSGNYLVVFGTSLTALRTYTLPEASVFGTGLMVITDTWALGPNNSALDASALFVPHSGDTILNLGDADFNHNLELFQAGSSAILQSNGVDTWTVIGIFGPQRNRNFTLTSGSQTIELANLGTVFSTNLTSTVVLPGPAVSVSLDMIEYHFVVRPGGSLTIQANGSDKIAEGGTVSVAGGTIVSSTSHSTLTLMMGLIGSSPNFWLVKSKTGTWVIT